MTTIRYNGSSNTSSSRLVSIVCCLLLCCAAVIHAAEEELVATPSPTAVVSFADIHASPTVQPNVVVTDAPIIVVEATLAPTDKPTRLPTDAPTARPTRKPTTAAPVTEAPLPVVIAKPTISRPTPTSAKAPSVVRAPKAPVVVQAPAKAPGMVRAPAKAPIIVRAPTKAPVMVRAPTKVPVVVRSPTKTPTTVQAPTNVPVTLRAPTKAPITKAPITKAPITKSPITKAPVASAATTSPVVSPRAAPTGPVLPPVVPFPPILINCGGAKFTDSRGREWIADKFFKNGNRYTRGDLAIANTLDDPIFQSERYGSSVYNIPVPNGDYVVNLHFAEIYFNTPGQRIFDVNVEGTLLPDVDIVTFGGANAAVLKSVLVSVTDGSLTINFLANVPKINDAKISGIEVYAAGQNDTVPVPAPTRVPIRAPTKVPVTVRAPSKAPLIPVQVPTKHPNVAPLRATPANVTKAPVSEPAFAPNLTPVRGPVRMSPSSQAPVLSSSNAPLWPPSKVPTTKVPAAVTPSKAPAASATTTSPVVSPRAATTSPVVSPRAAPTGPILPPVVPFPPMLINCGGAKFTDSRGREWVADKFFKNGNRYTRGDVAIANTLDDPIFQSERYGNSIYNLPVPNGDYVVNLHFAEIYFNTTGQRIFDVNVEGTLLPDVDIVKFGGANAATFKSVMVRVTDGSLTINFLANVPKVNDAKISGIEVYAAGQNDTLPVPAPTRVPVRAPTKEPIKVTPAPVKFINPTRAPMTIPTAPTAFVSDILINCGGGTYKDRKGRSWMADTYFQGGTILAAADNLAIKDTDDDQLYRSERMGNAVYEIPIPSGTYNVTFHMAELVFKSSKQRLFDINVEGIILDDVDIVKLGGGSGGRAIQRMVGPVTVFDGRLTIRLMNNIPAVSDAKLSGIEIVSTIVAPVAPTVPSPIPVPIATPVVAPKPVSPMTPASPISTIFKNVLINCGGEAYVDTQDRKWSADAFFIGGETFSKTSADILDTDDDAIFHSERFGPRFTYEIPMPRGTYEVIIHFAEIAFTKPGERLFSIDIEGTLVSGIDIVQQGGGIANKAIKREAAVPVADGFLTLNFLENVPRLGDPKISGIEVKLTGTHFSHAVPGGPYFAVDTDGNGVQAVKVDGSESHTHGPDNVMTSWIWKKGATVLGAGEVVTLTLPVGEHTITLVSTDNSGDINSETTTVTILSSKYPSLNALSPISGNVAGGTKITMTGSAFGSATAVRFGQVMLFGKDITVVNDSTITVVSPVVGVALPVSVSVITPVGESGTLIFSYVGTTPIRFVVESLMAFAKPTAVAFGPDSKLYVGNTKGQLGKFTLNDSYDAVVSSVVATIGSPDRGIHGIAFDPLESADVVNPTVYLSSSDIFHGESRSTFGQAINGKIQTVRGANLDRVTDLVTGLPVSELDHTVNGIFFGNNGELYIGVGSNTNGGIPGELSGSRIMKDSYFSAAILVAHLGEPGFNGLITYNAPIDGDPVTGFGPKGVEVYASGLRNPYGVVVHSNGQIYATDNGPNVNFGDMATGCGPGQQIPDAYEKDKLVRILNGNYYGAPNLKRGAKDPRQCVWRAASLPSGDGYTAPMMRISSATTGIVEFEANHFNGQLRGNLILSKYKGEAFRVILTPDGTAVEKGSNPAIPIGGTEGLAITQAPNGNLVDARYGKSECHFFRPNEVASGVALAVKSVFPRRGALIGGTTLSVYGNNFKAPATVMVGDGECSNVVVVSPNKLMCRLPPGSLGVKDIVVTVNGASDTFAKGYRYITGKPV